jgi:DNA repair protein RadD
LLRSGLDGARSLPAFDVSVNMLEHMAIRDYQRTWLDDIYAARDRARARLNKPNIGVTATLPTGGGKTFSFVTAIREQRVPSAVTVHRSELLAQAALTMNREQMPHNIEAPTPLIREIIRAQMELHGRSYYSDRAPVHVASIQTLARRKGKLRWPKTIEFLVNDEGHHAVRGGIWNDALNEFPNAWALFPTAHALRADGLGLGAIADGFADELVVGPSARTLIGRGFLSDYRVAIPPADIDLSDVDVTASGDFSPVQLAAAVHGSGKLVGHVAEHYCRLAGGKLERAYAALGVPAAIITGETSIVDRAAIMKRFRSRQLLQLVSVEVLGEGTDVPDVEVVSMARPTASFQLYAQQLGRALRVSVDKQYADRWDAYTDAERLAIIAASKKPRALILDHVGNFTRHYAGRGGPPCAAQDYTLLRVEKKARGPAKAAPIALRTCLNVMCLQPYERALLVCPHCGTPAPLPGGRGSPEEVDGDLVLLDPTALTVLTKEIARIDGPGFAPKGVAPHVKGKIEKEHLARQRAQAWLRKQMMVWGGWRIHVHGDERRGQREFFLKFGVDVLTAQTLNEAEADALTNRILDDLAANNVREDRGPDEVFVDDKGPWKYGPKMEVVRL